MASNHTDVVERVKADLEARGVSLAGVEGAFEITKRVAWELRGESAGLLSKPGGTNAHGYAADIVCYPDGHIYDILVSSGEANGPAWQDKGLEDPNRYVPAFDPGDAPTGGGDTGTGGGDERAELIAALDRIVEGLSNMEHAVANLGDELQKVRDGGVKVRW